MPAWASHSTCGSCSISKNNYHYYFLSAIKCWQAVNGITKKLHTDCVYSSNTQSSDGTGRVSCVICHGQMVTISKQSYFARVLAHLHLKKKNQKKLLQPPSPEEGNRCRNKFCIACQRLELSREKDLLPLHSLLIVDHHPLKESLGTETLYRLLLGPPICMWLCYIATLCSSVFFLWVVGVVGRGQIIKTLF